MATSVSAQTFKTLDSLNSTDGFDPTGPLVQATDGNLYGTTPYGGANSGCDYGCGTVFKMSPHGKLTTLYSFCSQPNCADGRSPFAGLIQAGDGNLYGTTVWGGVDACSNQGYGCGTIFRITPAGKLTTLYDFCSQSGCADGENSEADLVQGGDGSLYGTAGGGANNSGIVFKITLSGALTTLYNFCSQEGCSDGVFPSGLFLAADGNFYGTTLFGGIGTNGGYGTIFRITPNGSLITLYSFCSQNNCTDGEYPRAAPVEGSDGSFYGTTSGGGANNGGTVFKITSTGTLTTLYSFCSQARCTDGGGPMLGFVRGTDGNFYGTTDGGGEQGGCKDHGGCGTAFKISSTGALATLHRFDWTDGALPYAGLVQDTNGNLYGTTGYGGSSGACPGDCGTVFSLAVGLRPFVETQPTSAKVGKPINVLGTSLTGATSVTFNGTAAAFTVVSPSLITTTVPAGATTGTVQVVTPGGTLKSNVPFRVIQ